MKILRDQPYSRLNLEEDDKVASITLPVLDFRTLCSSVRQSAPGTRYLGNSIFELADVLQLLTDQANHHLLQVKEVALTDLTVGKRGYYARISQNGLLRLACQQFHSVYEEDNTLFVRTTIGTFEFFHSKRGNVVRFSARDRAFVCIAPKDQDFFSVQQCALSRFCVRENLNNDYLNRGMSPVGPPEWLTLRPHDAVALQNLTHTRCVRFLTTEEYEQFQQEHQFAETTLSEAFEVLQRRPNYFDDYTKEGLGLIKVMAKKALRDAEHLSISVTTAKWVLGGLAKMPPDVPGTVEAIPSPDEESDMSEKPVDDLREDFEAFVLSQHGKKAENGSPITPQRKPAGRLLPFETHP